jgi:hypothetical protein
MMWALLIFLGVVAAVHWWEYQNSVQEYTFATPANLDLNRELRPVFAEKTPIMVEIGPLPWRPEIAEKAPWTAVTEDGVSMSIGAWLKEEPRPALTNQSNLAQQTDLAAGLADIDGGRAWWWLPGVQDTSIDVLPAGGIVGLSWVTAERQWIGCSSGSPLTVWLVHSRYRRFLPGTAGAPIDPWSLTAAEAPWIGRVQYIEVRIRPGWCLGLPAHWGWAVKTEEPAESWWWLAAQHSPLSWVLSNMSDKAPEHTESSMTESEE